MNQHAYHLFSCSYVHAPFFPLVTHTYETRVFWCWNEIHVLDLQTTMSEQAEQALKVLQIFFSWLFMCSYEIILVVCKPNRDHTTFSLRSILFLCCYDEDNGSQDDDIFFLYESTKRFDL